MSTEYSLWPLYITVYVLRVQFMSQEYSLYPQSTIYVLIVQFMSSEYSLCHKSAVYVPRVVFV